LPVIQWTHKQPVVRRYFVRKFWGPPADSSARSGWIHVTHFPLLANQEPELIVQPEVTDAFGRNRALAIIPASRARFRG